MKKQILNLFAGIVIGIAFVACKNDSKKAETSDAKIVEVVNAESKYIAIPNQSMTYWKANKIVGGHEGTINLSNGFADLKNNQLVGGNFTFDITTLKCTDIPAEDEGNAKLVEHLMSKDFFDTNEFATANFVITKVENNMISGNLTLKGITKNISFPAKVTLEDTSVIIKSKTFTIDRTEFNINYNSGKTMDAAELGDYLIKDDVELKISVIAKKA